MKKYEQLYDVLKNRIDSLEYRFNDKLPTEAELAAIYSVSRQTVRNALAKLKAINYISSTQGSGYTVTVRKAYSIPKNIAVITTHITDSIFPYVLSKIEKTATENGYSVGIWSTGNSIGREAYLLNSILSNNSLAGVIVSGTKAALPNINTKLYQEFLYRKIPVVFFNSIYYPLTTIKDPNLCYVLMDEYAGCYKATSDLIAKGHSKIAAIFKSDDYQGIKRYEGYAAAIRDHHLEYQDRFVYWVTTENYYVNENYLKAISSECSSLVCYCDHLFSKLAGYFRKYDSSIIDVVSFDRDTYIHLKDGMTFYSLGYQKEKMGEVITNKLINMINGKEEIPELLPWIE